MSGNKNISNLKNEKVLLSIKLIISVYNYKYLDDYLDLFKKHNIKIDKLIITTLYQGIYDKKFTPEKESFIINNLVSDAESNNIKYFIDAFPLCNLHDKNLYNYLKNTTPSNDTTFDFQLISPNIKAQRLEYQTGFSKCPVHEKCKVANYCRNLRRTQVKKYKFTPIN